MIHLSDRQISELLDYPGLIAALEMAFRSCEAPPERLHYPIGPADAPDGHLLVMPAWHSGGKIGVKIASVFPGNAALNLPTVNATYLLLDAKTGVAEMMMDARELTRRRTAAASALAARYLARRDAKSLLMVGTGSMSECLIAAHCSNQPIEKVQVWGRRTEQARRVAGLFSAAQFDLAPVTDLERAVASADIISCATMATEPLIRGDWLQPGQHLDLVGAFTPAMREVDDEALRRAAIYVDTRAGALREAGEVVQGLRDGVIDESDIRGDLFGLTRGDCRGRESERQITLFKSVGTSLEDLAAAELVAERFAAVREAGAS